MFDFRGRVAIITGAVGNLGLATARAFQLAGARTVLVDRSEERLRQAYSELTNPRDHLLTVYCPGRLTHRKTAKNDPTPTIANG